MEYKEPHNRIDGRSVVPLPGSPKIEVPEEKKIATEKNPITLFLGLHRSKLVVCQLSLLFMIDSFAGSFVFQSFISEWFSLVYSTPASTMGFVLFVCNISEIPYLMFML